MSDPNTQGPFDHDDVYRALADPREEHIEKLLDQALEATFPASDPIAVTPVSRRRPSPPR